MIFAVTFTLVILVITAVFYSKYQTVCNNAALSIKVKNQYINTVIIFFIVVAGLRNIAVGPDTANYYRMYELIEQTSWNKLFYDFGAYYTLGIGKDPGYPIFEKISQLVLPNYRSFLILIACLFYLSAGYLIKTFSRNFTSAFYALLMFIAIFQIYAFSSIRQDIALSCTMFSVFFIRKRKMIPYLFLILLASTVHQSALLFIPYYWIAQIKQTKTLSFLTIISLPVLFFFAKPILRQLADSSGTESYMTYVSTAETGGTPTYTFLLLCCFIAYLTVRKKMASFNPKYYIYANTIFITVAFVPASWIDSALMRMALYYSSFLPVVLSNSLTLFSSNMQRVIAHAYVILICYFIITTFPTYDFFWNYMPLGDNYSETFNTVGI